MMVISTLLPIAAIVFFAAFGKFAVEAYSTYTQYYNTDSGYLRNPNVDWNACNYITSGA